MRLNIVLMFIVGISCAGCMYFGDDDSDYCIMQQSDTDPTIVYTTCVTYG